MSAREIPQRHANKTPDLRSLAILSFTGLGILYSDLATSPLYVLNGVWKADGDVPSSQDVIGVISAVFWALTLIPLVKYAIIGLHFGTEQGDGGVFALYMSLFPRHHSLERDRELTKANTKEGALESSRSIKSLARFRWPLVIYALFGTSMLISDGILTPATSVVSAVGGIAVAKPAVLNSVVGISIAFLVPLFLVQRFGTNKISFTFTPVAFIWLLIIGGSGIYNIAQYPGIFRAVDPSRAIMYFVRTQNFGAMSGVLLALTGSEAMIANLGQFNPASIRVGFVYTYLCLILAYLGQGARLIVDGQEALGNLFYKTIPGPQGGGLYWITFASAILACLVASQTLITSTFSILQQLVSFNSSPHFRMIFTNTFNQGQVYFPFINYTLMVGVIGVIGGFQTSYALTNAFGMAVSTVMFVTDLFLFIAIVYVKNKSWLLAFAYLIFFGFIDACFWGSSLHKVPEGAWFPLAFGGAVWVMLVFYTWARQLEERFDASNAVRLSQLIHKADSDFSLRPIKERDSRPIANVASLRKVSGEVEIESDPEEMPEQIEPITLKDSLVLAVPEGYLDLHRIPTFAIFHKAEGAGAGVPHVFHSFLCRWPALPRVVVFLSTVIVGQSHVEAEDRYIISKNRQVEGLYSITAQLGYRDGRPDYISDILERLVSLEAMSDPKRAAINIEAIRTAARTATHITPSNVISAKPITRLSWLSWPRQFLLEEIYGRVRVMMPDDGSMALAGGKEVIKIGIEARL